MTIKPGDIVESASGGYGPVEKIAQIDGILYYWIDFRYGYSLAKKGINHRMWATDVMPMNPGAGRPRQYSTNAERQKAYRERLKKQKRYEKD